MPYYESPEELAHAARNNAWVNEAIEHRAGRPPLPLSMRKILKGIRLSPDAWMWLETCAAAKGVSQAEFLEILLEREWNDQWAMDVAEDETGLMPSLGES